MPPPLTPLPDYSSRSRTTEVLRKGFWVLFEALILVLLRLSLSFPPFPTSLSRRRLPFRSLSRAFAKLVCMCKSPSCLLSPSLSHSQVTRLIREFSLVIYDMPSSRRMGLGGGGKETHSTWHRFVSGLLTVLFVFNG